MFEKPSDGEASDGEIEGEEDSESAGSDSEGGGAAAGSDSDVPVDDGESDVDEGEIEGEAPVPAAAEQVDAAIPFVFDCPTTLSELQAVTDKWCRTAAHLRTVLARIRACNSLHLRAENRGKLTTLVRLLLKLAARMAAQPRAPHDMVRFSCAARRAGSPPLTLLWLCPRRADS